MTEYIERNKALNVCERLYQLCLEMRDWRGDTIAWNIGAGIKAIPAADVVEVVRCKDCKYGTQSEASEHYYDCRNYFGCSQHKDYYCADGERKG